jgi:hypothetical protein
VAFQYRQEIEQQLGAALPPMASEDKSEDDKDYTLAPEIEVQLSALVAQAAQQLLQKNQGEMAQQQAAQQAQDTLIQMQQQELAIKKQDADRKAKKDMADAAAKADDLELRKTQEENRVELEGARLGIDIAKHKFYKVQCFE